MKLFNVFDYFGRPALSYYRRGLREVIPAELLSLFCAPELQVPLPAIYVCTQSMSSGVHFITKVLLSGTSSGVNMEELRRSTRYAAGYSALDININRFWNVMASLSEEDRAAVVRFVTACERPPCLGWGSLQPPFTIQVVLILKVVELIIIIIYFLIVCKRVECQDDSRLPSASTCFNVLKLPTYSSQSILKEKLLLAVKAAGGFHLS